MQFHDFPEIYSLNTWRKIAGNGSDYPLKIRSATWIQDMRLVEHATQTLTPAINRNFTLLFYVFNGEIRVNENLVLRNGESVLIENEQLTFTGLQTSDVVLFITDKNSSYFEGGMYSGNQK